LLNIALLIKDRQKGSLRKAIIHQISEILIEHEMNLTQKLKLILDKNQNHAIQCKHQIQRIFDFIIQGNINELDSSIQRAYASVEQCQHEFLHTLHQYSINKFACRYYSKFFRDVIADKQQSKLWE
jgi:hypothetical protein